MGMGMGMEIAMVMVMEMVKLTNAEMMPTCPDNGFHCSNMM